MDARFIQQKRDFACAIISLLNAKRFYGYDTPSYGDKEFDYLVHISGAQFGAAIHIDTVAQYLGLTRVTIPRVLAHLHFPFTFACYPPRLPCHDVLAISGSKSTWKVVNYHGPHGSVVCKKRIKDLNIVKTWFGCDHKFRQFWHISLETHLAQEYNYPRRENNESGQS